MAQCPAICLHQDRDPQDTGGLTGAAPPTCFRMVISRLICSVMPLRISCSLSSTCCEVRQQHVLQKVRAH